MARAIWPRRWGLNLSVLRRSWPKLENQELVRSTGHLKPRVWVRLVLASPLGVFLVFLVLGALLRFFLAQTTSVSPRPRQRPVVRKLS